MRKKLGEWLFRGDTYRVPNWLLVFGIAAVLGVVLVLSCGGPPPDTVALEVGCAAGEAEVYPEGEYRVRPGMSNVYEDLGLTVVCRDARSGLLLDCQGACDTIPDAAWAPGARPRAQAGT